MPKSESNFSAPRLRSISLRRKLHQCGRVFGTFMEIPSPAVVELLGLAGFDFVVVDGEHGPFDNGDIEYMVRAGFAADISVVVRVAENHTARAAQPLDWGAAGVQIPHISGMECARNAVRATKYHPIGERGIQPYVRAASYRTFSTADYLAGANEDTLLVAQVEGVEGVRNLESLLALDGIDVVFIGPYDLSQSLGIPGQVTDRRVKHAVADAVRLASMAGKWIGTFCDDVQTALAYSRIGVSYLTVSIDASIFLTGARALIEKLRS